MPQNLVGNRDVKAFRKLAEGAGVIEKIFVQKGTASTQVKVPAAADTPACFVVVDQKTAATAGDEVSVAYAGEVVVIANEALSIGDLITHVITTGYAKKLVTTDGANVIHMHGIALTACSAQGEEVRILLTHSLLRGA